MSVDTQEFLLESTDQNHRTSITTYSSFTSDTKSFKSKHKYWFTTFGQVIFYQEHFYFYSSTEIVYFVLPAAGLQAEARKQTLSA